MLPRLLRYFLATYNHLNITEAADALCITQPALTKSIHALEAELGVKLFDRLPNGVVPTPYGEVLAKHATTIFLEYEHAIAEVEAMKTGSAGTIRIAAGPIWLVKILPSVIREFRLLHPGVKLVLESSVINKAVPALLRGDIDLFCGSLDFPDHPDLVKREVAQIDHIVMARKTHPLFSEEEFKPAHLLRYPWAMLSNDDVGRRQLSSFFARNGLKSPSTAMESSSVVSIMELLRNDDYFTCLARPLLEDFRFDDLAEVKGTGVIWRYDAGMAIRNRRHVPQITQRFMDIVAAHYRSDVISPRAKMLT